MTGVSGFALTVLAGAGIVVCGHAETVVVCPPDAAPQVRLAAREVARYVYLRTGKRPAVAAAADGPAITLSVNPSLGAENYTLKTEGAVTRVTGGDPLGVLYGAYRYAERLGVRFYLHGDVVPDERLAALPQVSEAGKPLFSIRGIQPFHDFPEGPDWWNRDDYLAYLAQLAKMRMNFIGMHCYPEGRYGPEPLVWIGQPSDLDADGRATFTYPAQWAHTGRDGMWGYAGMKTSDFSAGAASVFETDDFGPDAQDFEGVADLMGAVTAEARRLGVKTCIGTETPLTVPRLVQERLKAQGKDPRDPAVVAELYEGMFRRIAARYPVDYYWLWTPERWTWHGNKKQELETTETDIRAALSALGKLGNPFTLATCGWVLGPQQDRAALDRLLPKNVPMSCINRRGGHKADEPYFANITGRPKWVIPWLENDADLIAPQLWAGRMRWDAADALRLGCTGLLGIHWRTKQMAPNVAALAAAAWDQPWLPSDYDRSPLPPVKEIFGALGGTSETFQEPDSGADLPTVYKTMRCGMSAYLIDVPNGRYTVTLKFSEPLYREAGKRVFAVQIQNKTIIDRLDLFDKAGANRAADLSFEEIAVEDSVLRLDFDPVVGQPCLAGIVITGKTAGANQLAGEAYTRRINCGGGAVSDYEADRVAEDRVDAPKERAMPVADFYRDFAKANFGAGVAEAAGTIFERIDGVNMPEDMVWWIKGPGGILVEKRPWPEIQPKFEFVKELETVRSQLKGAGNLERFDYWLNTFRYLASLAELGCVRGELDALMSQMKTDGSLASRALGVRVRLSRQWETMMTYQLAAADTPGEFGTVANLEQHNRVFLKFLSEHDEALEQALGAPLPAEIELSRRYAGPARLIVPTVRTQLAEGDTLHLRVIVLDAAAPQSVVCYWRRLGQGPFEQTAVRSVGRAVYVTALPPTAGDFEYYIQAKTAAGQTLVWPATAPDMNQTVVVCPDVQENP
ncbi:MAG: hypothetical protein GX565_11925 [Lentisphaerae bacterium]|nr:hypothetical protein [Lentisphaerota bacterium]